MNKQEINTINQAISILENNLKKEKGLALESPETVVNFLRLELEREEREVFIVMFLDVQNRLIESDKMFLGTINKAEIHIREIAKKALSVNAFSVLLAHNHPSGDSTPSQSDLMITKKIQQALELFEIKMLDHIIIGKGETTSFLRDGII